MSSRTIDLLFGAPAQTLYFDVPEGRPSVVRNSQVFEITSADDGTEEDAISSSASIDAVSTTFDAASGDGQTNPQKCNLAATASVRRGGVYLATDASGETEWVEVTSIVSADYVVGREPLKNAYANADTFVGTRISQVLDSDWVEDDANISGDYVPTPRYRWRLEYTVASTVYVRDIYFDLLRYAGRHDVTGLDCDRRAPGWLQRLATRHQEDQGRDVIDDAYEVIKFDLYNYETPDQSIRDRGAVNELVTLKAVELVDGTDVAAKRYADRLEQLIGRARVSVSHDSSGSAQLADLRPIWRR